MSDEEIQVFIDGVVRYFQRTTGEPAVEVDPPYLKGEDSVTLDFTGVIGISGRHRGAVYFTSCAEQLTALLQRFGETVMASPTTRTWWARSPIPSPATPASTSAASF